MSKVKRHACIEGDIEFYVDVEETTNTIQRVLIRMAKNIVPFPIVVAFIKNKFKKAITLGSYKEEFHDYNYWRVAKVVSQWTSR